MIGDAVPSVYGNDSSFEDASTPHTVSFDIPLQDLNVSFVDTSGLVEADSWTILISACGAVNPLPAGASAVLTSQDGTSAVAQLTLDRGFEGTVSGSHDVYSVNQHFTVRAAGTEMQSITISNTGSSTSWTNGSPSYTLDFNGSTPTACFAYDAEDWELEVRRYKTTRGRELPCDNYGMQQVQSSLSVDGQKLQRFRIFAEQLAWQRSILFSQSGCVEDIEGAATAFAIL